MTTLTARPGISANTLGKLTRDLGPLIVLIVLVAAVTAIQPSFLTFPNAMNLLSQWAPVGIMAIGMTYVVITGGFDLSVGAVYGLTAVVAAMAGQVYAPLVAFTFAVLVGLVAGAVNGLVVTVLRVNPFIATLGTSLILSGITLLATGNKSYVVSGDQFGILGTGRVLGIPYSGLLMIVLMILAGLILAYTVFGQQVYAVGGNTDAARLAGVPTTRITVSAYVISGVCAGLAGIISASQLSSARPTTDTGLVFDVLTVVVVGGTALTGGRGAIWRTAVGLAVLAVLQNAFNLANIDPNYQDIIKGAIVIAALAHWRLPSATPLRRPITRSTNTS